MALYSQEKLTAWLKVYLHFHEPPWAFVRPLGSQTAQRGRVSLEPMKPAAKALANIRATSKQPSTNNYQNIFRRCPNWVEKRMQARHVSWNPKKNGTHKLVLAAQAGMCVALRNSGFSKPLPELLFRLHLSTTDHRRHRQSRCKLTLLKRKMDTENQLGMFFLMELMALGARNRTGTNSRRHRMVG